MLLIKAAETDGVLVAIFSEFFAQGRDQLGRLGTRISQLQNAPIPPAWKLPKVEIKKAELFSSWILKPRIGCDAHNLEVECFCFRSKTNVAAQGLSFGKQPPGESIAYDGSLLSVWSTGAPKIAAFKKGDLHGAQESIAHKFGRSLENRTIRRIQPPDVFRIRKC
jgi:hypothetical protein